MNKPQLSTIFLLLSFSFCLTSSASAQSGAYAVQVAAVPSRAEADLIVSGLKANGLDAYLTTVAAPGQGVFYRVRIGRLASLKRAEAYGRQLKDSGLVTEFWPTKYETPLYAPAAPPRPATRTAKAAPVNTPLVASDEPAASQVVHNPRQNVFVKASQEKPVGPTGRAAVQAAARGTVAENNKVNAGSAPAPLTPPASPPLSPPLSPKAADGSLNRTAAANVKAAAEPAENEIDPLTDFAEFTPPAVKGRVESADGQMLLKLRNTSDRYRFRGKVRLVIAEGKEEPEPEPLPIALMPNEENTFDLSAAKLKNGSYWVTVYDEQNVLQLIRAASFRKDSGTPPPADALAQQNPGDPSFSGGQGAEQQPVYQPGEAAPAAAAPTSIGPPPAPPQELDATSNNPNGISGQAAAANVQPGEVKVVARVLAVTTENMTIEFEITAPQPLGYIALSLQTPSINDVKQAIMTTRQGRIPFLAPAADAQGAFRYELKDEQGRVLATGSNTFKQISAN